MAQSEWERAAQSGRERATQSGWKSAAQSRQERAAQSGRERVCVLHHSISFALTGPFQCCPSHSSTNQTPLWLQCPHLSPLHVRGSGLAFQLDQ